jgi:cell division protein FtsW
MRPVQRRVDHVLLSCVLALLALGIVMVYSAAGIRAEAVFGHEHYYVTRQILFAAVGLGVMLVAARIPYQAYKRWTYPLLGVVMLLLIGVFIPGVGSTMGGATRWIDLGYFYLQPSEVAKFALVLYLAYSLTKKQDHISSFSIGILPHLMVSGVALALILLEPDFGTTAVLASILFAMMFVAGTRILHLSAIFAVAAPLAFVVLIGAEYRRRRLLAFLDPWADQADTGFHIIQSWLAFHRGGLFGVGLGAGTQKLFYLPAAHTDFIFSVVGEELGLVGVLLTIGAFGLFIARGTSVARRAPDLFGQLLGTGITFIIGLQAVINMMVVTGLLPTKGLTLPFVSYGGSSLVAYLFMVGVLLNISSQALVENRRIRGGGHAGSRRRWFGLVGGSREERS